MIKWTPSLGSRPAKKGVHFSVWAPAAQSIHVVLEESPTLSLPLEKDSDGFFHGVLPQARVGSLYRYQIDSQGLYPDPASRYQPRGVHGPSEVVDSDAFTWTDKGWRGSPALNESLFYELHVGTFTPAGTFAALIERLPYLAELGITTLELMPVADFAGRHNWGYDGVCLFAPARVYGRPDDLRRLVDAAHHLGLAVFLDVVYNHLGPDGNYLNRFSPFYFTTRHHTPWGSAVNLDSEHADEARGFFIENALHWVHEYHIDGLRLDATHAMKDDSQRPFLAELAERVHSTFPNRQVLLVAEDCRNLSKMITPETQGGWGLDGVWSDDFHHQVRRSMAGDHEGYFRDFSGSLADVAATIQKGWFFTGQPSEHFKGPRGTDPNRIPFERFVFFLQNHDQIGNRAFGERLSGQIDASSYRAASALLLCAPECPMLFMGQEWSASSPFLYFTDHHKELGAWVTKGRRQEFKNFSIFTDPASLERIPDPQDPAVFKRSRLNWTELEQPAHSQVRRLYHDLMAWRRRSLSPLNIQRKDFSIKLLGPDTVALNYGPPEAVRYSVLIQWKGAQSHKILGGPWDAMLSTEDSLYAADSQNIFVSLAGGQTTIEFKRPGAVILKASSQ